METFNYLSSICKYAKAYAENNQTRRSMDFPTVPESAVAFAVQKKEAIVFIPNYRTLIVCPTSICITSDNMCKQKAKAQVELVLDGKSYGRVNEVMHLKACEIVCQVCDETDHFIRSISSSSPTPSNENSGNLGITIGSPRSESTYMTFSLAHAKPDLKSMESVISLAQIHIGSKMLRMQRFTSPFLEDNKPLIVLTGFGIAGGVCEILACMLQHKYGDGITIKLVAYGSPAVGDSVFVTKIDRLVQRYYKIILNRDLMVHALQGHGYRTHKNIVRLGRSGEYKFSDMWCGTLCLCGARQGLRVYDIDDYILAIRQNMQADSKNKLMVGCIEDDKTI